MGLLKNISRVRQGIMWNISYGRCQWIVLFDRDLLHEKVNNSLTARKMCLNESSDIIFKY